ncbi:MAG TPA: hypothetical protein VMC42_04780 [Methanoregulaceae archaeon]|nr:hypothetical protein [Methanoregulaceae archaeon]
MTKYFVLGFNSLAMIQKRAIASSSSDVPCCHNAWLLTPQDTVPNAKITMVIIAIFLLKSILLVRYTVVPAKAVIIVAENLDKTA